MKYLEDVLVGFCYGFGGTLGYKLALWLIQVIGR